MRDGSACGVADIGSHVSEILTEIKTSGEDGGRRRRRRAFISISDYAIYVETQTRAQRFMCEKRGGGTFVVYYVLTYLVYLWDDPR